MTDKTKGSIIQGKDIAFNRLALENKNTKIIILSHENKKDKLKQRDSGLNEVLCRLARKNDIILAIDLSELKNKEKKEKAIILARIIQNIKLIKKFKNKFRLLNYTNPVQAFSFLINLGLDTNLAKEAVS